MIPLISFPFPEKDLFYPPPHDWYYGIDWVKWGKKEKNLMILSSHCAKKMSDKAVGGRGGWLACGGVRGSRFGLGGVSDKYL